MIPLTKGTIPKVLEDNCAEWTVVLLDHLEANTTPTDTEKSRYRHLEIKAALVKETHGKCAYCESKLTHITYGDIEHIVPKSLIIEKTFDWSNLTLACDICNTNKSDHFGNHEDLVDPYIMDPEIHFYFLGAVVIPRAHSNPALMTEKILVLNRIDLVERRMERLLSVSRLMHFYAKETDPNLKAVLLKDIETNEVAYEKEYSAMIRAYVAMELKDLTPATA